MDRKATAKETLIIMEQGYYELDGKRIDISGDMERSIEQSFLLTPKQGEELLEKYSTSKNTPPENCAVYVENISTVDAVYKLAGEGRSHWRAEFCQRQESRGRLPQRGHGTGGESGCVKHFIPDPDRS